MFALLYGHAYRKRREIGLTPLDIFDVKALAGHHLLSVGVGLIAVLVATTAPLAFAPLSPMSFGLMGPAHWGFANQALKRRNALEKQLSAGPPTVDGATHHPVRVKEPKGAVQGNPSA